MMSGWSGWPLQTDLSPASVPHFDVLAMYLTIRNIPWMRRRACVVLIWGVGRNEAGAAKTDAAIVLPDGLDWDTVPRAVAEIEDWGLQADGIATDLTIGCQIRQLR
jgi:hypothetical protein